MARPSHLARLAAALSPLLLPASAAAAPTWSALPDGPASGVAQQRAAGDGAGQTIAWQQAAGSGTELWAARRDAGAAALGPAVRVSAAAGSSATVSEVVLSADAQGRAAVAWTGRTAPNANGIVQVATRASRTAAWSAPVAVSDAASSANTPSVAVDANGSALVAWRQVTSGYTEARLASVTGSGATAVQTVASANANVSLPRVAVDPAGNAALAWVETGISYSPPYIGAVSLKAMSRVAGASTFTKTVSVFNASSQSIVDPQLAMDEAGNGTLAWQMVNTESGAADGVWVASRPLGSAGWAAEWPSGSHACAPAIGTSQAGGAVVAWVEPADGTCSTAAGTVGVARRTPGTTAWELNHEVSAAGVVAGPPAVSVGPNGTAVVAWPAGATATSDRVQAAVFAPAASDFWPASDVAAASGIASTPAIAVESTGAAVALWPRRASAGAAAVQAMSALSAASVGPGAPGTTAATPAPTPAPGPPPSPNPTPAPGSTPTPTPGSTPLATPAPALNATPPPATPAPAASTSPVAISPTPKPTAVPVLATPKPPATPIASVATTPSTSSASTKATATAAGPTAVEDSATTGLLGVRILAKKRFRPARCGAASLAERGNGMALQFRTGAPGKVRIVVTSTPRRGKARNLKPALSLAVGAGTTRTVFTGCLAGHRLKAGAYRLKLVFVGEDGAANGRRAVNFAISR